ncbi:hypothetical protein FQN60_002058 [Etheostoma spectabile]|uniref:Uncharacterized protein n=1 Tax=Etheostoma spectabile TaxID=54343 RepID=A0A5J5DD85_9PERO|nr:hypothetical protein FQN60_002058 [Etheostoma spectabile]
MRGSKEKRREREVVDHCSADKLMQQSRLSQQHTPSLAQCLLQLVNDVRERGSTVDSRCSCALRRGAVLGAGGGTGTDEHPLPGPDVSWVGSDEKAMSWTPPHACSLCLSRGAYRTGMTSPIQPPKLHSAQLNNVSDLTTVLPRGLPSSHVEKPLPGPVLQRAHSGHGRLAMVDREGRAGVGRRERRKEACKTTEACISCEI